MGFWRPGNGTQLFTINTAAKYSHVNFSRNCKLFAAKRAYFRARRLMARRKVSPFTCSGSYPRGNVNHNVF